MRINFNKKDIELMYDLVHCEIIYINDKIQITEYGDKTKKEKGKEISKLKQYRKKLRKINNALIDKIIEMEYYEEQNNNNTNNRNNNTFFKDVEEFLS